MGIKLTKIADVELAIDRLQRQYEQAVAFSKAVYAEKGTARPKGLSEATAVSFGKMLRSIAKGADGELKELGVMRGRLDSELEIKSALGTPLVGDSPTGSYLIPGEYASEILSLSAAQSELMNAVRKVTMAARTRTYPKRLAAVTFSYVASEGADRSESAPTFTPEVLTAKNYGLYFGVSEELLEDSVADLGQYVAEVFAEGWATCFDTQFLVGTGSPVTGLLKMAGTNLVTMSTNTFDAVSFEDIWDLVSALDTRAKRAGAVFFLNPTIFDRLSRLRDAQGNYLYMRPSEGRPGSILGYPILLSDKLPSYSESAANTAFIALGNPRYLIWGERVALEIKFFNATMYAVRNEECFFRGRVRAAMNITQPGAFAILKTHA